MEDDLFSRGPYTGSRNTRGGGGGLFWWSVVILLLAGAVIACWMGSFYVFAHPENPSAYELLAKLGKVEKPKRFAQTAAPTGEFLGPEDLYDRYSAMSEVQLQEANAAFLRSYIRNYAGQKGKIPYVIGRYNIIDSLELRDKDMFPTGAVVLARSTEMPAVLIEHVYPAEREIVPVLQRLLMTGLDIKLERTEDLSTILHVEKLGDGRLQVTVVPLLYGTYSMAQGTGTFSLDPPDALNVRAGFPIVRGEDFIDAEKRYAAARKSSTPSKSSILIKPMPSPPKDEPRSEPPQALSRATPSPKPTATPGVDVATAMAALGRTPQGRLPEATPAPTAARALPMPAPSATPALAAATPAPAPTSPPVGTPAVPPVAEVSPSGGVELKPFLAGAPVPAATPAPNTTWRTYRPGQMPRGRLVDVRSAPYLASESNAGERIYLQGDFTVTAAGSGRAVLKPRTGLAGRVADLARGSGQVKVIVDFPPDATPPAQGNSVQRGADRPFLITSVRRDSEGQIIVHAREVTSP